MSETALERMARKGRSPVETLDRFARACEVGIGAALNHSVSVTASGSSQATAREAVAGFDGGGMVLLLDAADGALGAMLIPQALVAGLVEMLTFGILSDGPLGGRKPTPTDAAVVEPVVNALLSEFARNSEDSAEPMRFGALLAPAHFARVMPEGALEEHWAEVSLAEERAGRLRVLSPYPEAPDTTPDPEELTQWRQDLGQTVTSAAVRAEAVLPPMTLSLSEVEEWQVGTTLTLPIDVLEQAVLRIAGGDTIATVRVGRLGGLRAVRTLEEPEDQTGSDLMGEVGEEIQATALTIPGAEAQDGTGLAEDGEFAFAPV